MLSARFDHWDNRVGDPNLHTHCAVLNRVFAERKWTTIDGRMFYRSAVAASDRYNARVADLVARKLGVSFAPRDDTPSGKHPVYEVEGIQLSLIEEFSRRQAIEDRRADWPREYLARHGQNPPKKVQYTQAQRATLDTRNAKNPPRSIAENARRMGRAGTGDRRRYRTSRAGRPRSDRNDNRPPSGATICRTWSARSKTTCPARSEPGPPTPSSSRRSGMSAPPVSRRIPTCTRTSRRPWKPSSNTTASRSSPRSTRRRTSCRGRPKVVWFGCTRSTGRPCATPPNRSWRPSRTCAPRRTPKAP
ncbi:MobF family relaxase [Rhodococcus koreensis]